MKAREAALCRRIVRRRRQLRRRGEVFPDLSGPVRGAVNGPAGELGDLLPRVPAELPGGVKSGAADIHGGGNPVMDGVGDPVVDLRGKVTGGNELYHADAQHGQQHGQHDISF